MVQSRAYVQRQARAHAAPWVEGTLLSLPLTGQVRTKQRFQQLKKNLSRFLRADVIPNDNCLTTPATSAHAPTHPGTHLLHTVDGARWLAAHGRAEIGQQLVGVFAHFLDRGRLQQLRQHDQRAPQQTAELLRRVQVQRYL